MKRSEMVKIVTACAALDRQPFDEVTVEMWLELFDGYSYDTVKAAIIPAYKESKSGFLNAKAVYDVVRREAMQPKPRAWVRDLHDIGEHFECQPEECARWTAENEQIGIDQ